MKRFFVIVRDIFTGQLAQAFSEHRVSTKVEAYSHTIIVQKDIKNNFTRQLTQAFLGHKVRLSKVEAHVHVIVVQEDIQNKISSVLTQQHVARILEAKILENINKSNHVRSPDSADITRQTTHD